MKTVFSTHDVHPRDRFAYWHDVACRTIIPHESAPDDAAKFYARLSATELNGLALLHVEAAPMMVSRDDRLISKTDHDDLLLCIQKEGAVKFQGTNDLDLGVGQATILDPRQSYSGKFEGAASMLVARIPRRDLERRMGATSPLVLQDIDTAIPDFQFVTMLLLGVMDGPRASDSGSEVLHDAFLDLLASALSEQLQGRSRLSITKERMLSSIRQVIRSHISDPTFSVEQAAALAGISVRYANSLLHDQNSSVGRLILAMRLQRCAHALADPAQSQRTIQEIAFSWGFTDQSYFGRKFKSAFGVSPMEYRRLGKQTAARRSSS